MKNNIIIKKHVINEMGNGRLFWYNNKYLSLCNNNFTLVITCTTYWFSRKGTAAEDATVTILAI